MLTSSAYRFYGRWETNNWFLEAKQKKEIVASEIYAFTDPQEPILAFFAPVLDKEGKINFFIVTQVDLKFLSRIIDFKIGEKGTVFLINSRGDIILHPQKSLLFEKISSDYSLKQNSALKQGITKFRFQGENLIAYFKVIEKYSKYPGRGWHLIIAQPESEIFAFLKTLRNQIYFFLLSAFILLLLISFFLGRYITQPLKKLTLATEKIKGGDLETQVIIKTRDEFGELAAVFNEMIRDLKKSHTALEEAKTVLEIKVQARTKELKDLAEGLEGEVKRRTKEIQEKMVELERFQRLAVGRELKMIELKEEIKKLKKELEKYKPA